MPSQTHYAASGHQSPDLQHRRTAAPASKSTTLASVDALLAEIQSEIQKTMEAPAPHPFRNNSAGVGPTAVSGTQQPSARQQQQQHDLVSSLPSESLHSPPRSAHSTYPPSVHSHSSQSDSAVHISEDIGVPAPIARAASERRARPQSQYSMHSSAAAATPPVILFSGFLRKQTHTGIPGINPVAFKPRFLVLTETFLYVFRSGNLTERAAEALPITIATNAAVGADGLWVLELGTKVTDVVSTGTAMRNWKLQCSSRDEMVEWLAVLRSAIDRAKIVAVTYGQTPGAYPNSNAGKGMQLDVLLGLAKPSGAPTKKGSVSSTASSSAATPTSRAPELMDTIRMLEDLELAHSNAGSSMAGSVRAASGEHAPPPYSLEQDPYRPNYNQPQYAQPHQPVAPASSSPSASHLEYHFESAQKHYNHEQPSSSSRPDQLHRVQSHPVHPTQPPHHALHSSASQHVSHPPLARGQQHSFHMEANHPVPEEKSEKQLKEEKKAAAKIAKEEKERAEKEKKKEKKKPYTQLGVHSNGMLGFGNTFM
ncbi:hypothetical protein HDU86_008443 [Geranomyces michiganensis]|nr:hypothetical protein HDU86_008443 [Geranomyces michiganensis]